MRITWLDISCSHSHSSLALPRLHAQSAHIGGVWSCVRGTVSDDVSGMVTRVCETRPALLAATCYLFTVPTVMAVIHRVKRILPCCKVLLGGPEFLGDNEAFLRVHPEADAVLRGEGDIAFSLILERLFDCGRWVEIPGLCWIDTTREYHDNGPGDEPDLRSLASPVSSPFFLTDRPFVQLETVRGCPFGCSYCTSAVTRRVRALPIGAVRQEIGHLRALGFREVRVLDRTFNVPGLRCARLLRLFRSEFADMRFHLEWHPGFETPSVRDELTHSPRGQLHLEVGFQTGDTAVLAGVARARPVEDPMVSLEWLCSCTNLEVHVDLLAGLPGQTLTGICGDAVRLVGLGPGELQLEVVKVLPGTPLAAAAGSLGIRHSGQPPYEVLCTEHLSVADLARIRRLMWVLDNFYNVDDLRSLLRDCITRCPGFLESFLELLERRGLGLAPMSLQNRLRWLHRFCRSCWPELRWLVEMRWLGLGLSAGHGIRPAELWRGAVPADAQLVEGRRPSGGGKTRVWSVCEGGIRYWFVFDRESQKKSAIGVLRTSDGASSEESS